MEATAEEIRRQMQLTRQRVGVEVTEVVEGARQFADWRFYPRHFPWATIGAAAVLGFAAIPKRPQMVPPDPATLEKLIRQHKLFLEAKASKDQQKGAGAAVVATLGSALLRFGLQYASNQFGRKLNETLLQRSGRESPT